MAWLTPLLVVFTLLLTPLYGYTQTPQTTLDRKAPTAKSLVNWWMPLPGFSYGKYLYDIMGGPPLTLTNMGTDGTTSGWGRPTRQKSVAEIRFDGTLDILVTPVNSASFPPYYTLLVWVRSQGSWPGSYATIWTAENGGGNLFISNGHLVTYSTGTIDAAPTQLATDTWYQVGLVLTPTHQRLYVNCRLDAEVATGVPAGVSTFYHAFGSKVDTTSPLSGRMNDMKFYNRGLSAGEICAAMQESQLGHPQLLPNTYAMRGNNPLGFLAMRVKNKFFPFFKPQ